MKKVILFIVILFSFNVISVVAIAASIEGSVQGFTCVTTGKGPGCAVTCGVWDDSRMALEKYYVVLTKENKYYLVHNIGRDVMIRYFNFAVRIQGELIASNTFEATVMYVYEDGMWKKVWDHDKQKMVSDDSYTYIVTGPDLVELKMKPSAPLPITAITLSRQAKLYKTQGKYAEAESLYKRSLEIYEYYLGKNNPSVAVPLGDLAVLYRTQGRYAEAESLYKRSLEILEEALGNHPDVTTVMENIIQCYREMGKGDKAKTLESRIRQIRSKQ